MPSRRSRAASRRLVAVGRVHLIAGAVAELRRRLGRIPERPIKGGSVLDRVAHDRQMAEPGLVQARADGRHHAVEHAAGRDQVGPGPGMADALFRQQRQGCVIVQVDAPANVLQDAAVAVIGVLAEAFVGDQQDSIPELARSSAAPAG